MPSDMTLAGNRDKYVSKMNCRDITRWDDLKHIELTSTLLIDGHCSSNSAVISSHAKGGNEIRVADLASLLGPRLRREHHLIRLLGCETGSPPTGGQCMASLLATWLGNWEFQNIHVGGYTRIVFHAKGYRAVINNDVNTTNSGNVVWFDRLGNLATKPNIQSDYSEYNPYFGTK
jgi:hypothetical protein